MGPVRHSRAEKRPQQKNALVIAGKSGEAQTPAAGIRSIFFYRGVFLRVRVITTPPRPKVMVSALITVPM